MIDGSKLTRNTIAATMAATMAAINEITSPNSNVVNKIPIAVANNPFKNVLICITSCFFVPYIECSVFDSTVLIPPKAPIRVSCIAL